MGQIFIIFLRILIEKKTHGFPLIDKTRGGKHALCRGQAACHAQQALPIHGALSRGAKLVISGNRGKKFTTSAKGAFDGLFQVGEAVNPVEPQAGSIRYSSPNYCSVATTNYGHIKGFELRKVKANLCSAATQPVLLGVEGGV